ncbi:HNH endonuclease [Clostridium saccharobutylicum]|uniref:HNH endonuclease 5 domain-containing protein n=1 Tax=Clostridium saccharobutylicum TaxID=169679 RepID=A0A1S8NJR9_CLOSA|nr:HNH endonuclease [Clostridium saccharobutylicum]OOM16739.1 hypothetical protein CLOSAC_10330 [Clostridium saccharobutylicum]
MSKCYICENEITKDNETAEHILLNAIGGTLKPKTLICKKCNSTLGEDIDAELANQLNYLCNMLNIERDRKKVPSLDVELESGQKILLKPGGKPVMKIPQKKESIKDNGKIKISIKAPDKESAKKVVQGLKRKYKEIDVDSILANCEKEKRYLNETCKIPIAVGGEKALRSICKTAINFYMLKGGSRKNIENLIPYIQGNKGSKCVQYYYKSIDIIEKTENEVLHSIIIKGKKDEKLLLAYVELFNCYRFVILLNDNYNGENIDLSYYFNVLTREEVKRFNNFDMSKNEVIELIEYSNIPTNELINEIDKVLKIASEKQESELIRGFGEKAINNSLSKYPKDILITEKMFSELVDEYMKEVIPWLANKLKK